MGLSMGHLLLIVIIIAIFFFKPGSITGLGKSMGKALRNFKDAMNEIEVDEKDIKEISSTEAQAKMKMQNEKENEKSSRS
ncbi:MAG: twin-arginine translocase TatA/TatE family subunit [Pseudobdellovibrionaceae bacterium]|jgi:sec-independent protein translocase protein TatA